MRKRKVKLFKIEKLLLRFLVIVGVLSPVILVLSKAALSDMNSDVEKLKRQINIQENANESLAMKVNELKSLANIDVVAESEGLSYNSSNIIVINN